MNLSNLLFFISTVSCRSGNRFTSLLDVPVLPQNTQQAMDIVSSVVCRTDFMAILIWTSEIQRFVFVENLKWNEIQFKMFQEWFYEQVSTPLCTLHRQICGFEGIMYCFQGNQQQRLVLELHISIKFLNWDAFIYKTKGTVVLGLLLPGCLLPKSRNFLTRFNMDWRVCARRKRNNSHDIKEFSLKSSCLWASFTPYPIFE
jgi:hypothetical protein